MKLPERGVELFAAQMIALEFVPAGLRIKAAPGYSTAYPTAFSGTSASVLDVRVSFRNPVEVVDEEAPPKQGKKAPRKSK